MNVSKTPKILVELDTVLKLQLNINFPFNPQFSRSHCIKPIEIGWKIWLIQYARWFLFRIYSHSSNYISKTNYAWCNLAHTHFWHWDHEQFTLSNCSIKERIQKIWGKSWHFINILRTDVSFPKQVYVFWKMETLCQQKSVLEGMRKIAWQYCVITWIWINIFYRMMVNQPNSASKIHGVNIENFS